MKCPVYAQSNTKLTSDKHVPDIAINTFFKKLEMPDTSEGFTSITNIPFAVDAEHITDNSKKQYFYLMY